jgi:pimeloyl-ACP methyl ester carboxylesterase
MSMDGRDGILRRVRSVDGTCIAFRRTGAGPPVLLVHGTGSTDRAWDLVRPFLERHLTVVRMQRRGRGESGDAPEYSLPLEGADIAAVVGAIGEPVDVLAHSHGAVCALEAALICPGIRRMALYEPPVESPHSAEHLARLDALLASGDRAGIVELAPRKAAGVADAGGSRPTPTEEELAVAATIPREARADRHFRVTPQLFGALTVPVLLLVGSATEPHFAASARRIQAVLPDCRTRLLPGQGHIANISAPGLLARAAIEFLTS